MENGNTLDDFGKYHEDMCNYARSLCIQRSKQYATSTSDWTSNIIQAAKLCRIKPSIGCLNRLLDKMHRISNLVSKEDKLNLPSVKDNVVDLINYSIILYYLTEQEADEHQPGDAGHADSL